MRVYAFDPGDMRTEMHQAAFPGEDISDRAEPESVVPALLHSSTPGRPPGRYRATDLVGARHARTDRSSCAPGSDATEPPEAHGIPRDGVKLLVARPDGIVHSRFAIWARSCTRATCWW